MHQLSLDEFVPKALPDAAPALHQLEQQGMTADRASRELRQEAIACITRRM